MLVGQERQEMELLPKKLVSENSAIKLAFSLPKNQNADLSYTTLVGVLFFGQNIPTIMLALQAQVPALFA